MAKYPEFPLKLVPDVTVTPPDTPAEAAFAVEIDTKPEELLALEPD